MFSYARPRWPLLFAPRTKLKGALSIQCHASCRLTTITPGFSPHEAHVHQAFLGWIMPTIRTSEFAVLQIVGLDAAVVSVKPLSDMICALTQFQLLNFLKMSFYLFFSLSLLAAVVLMPVNFKVCMHIPLLDGLNKISRNRTILATMTTMKAIGRPLWHQIPHL